MSDYKTPYTKILNIKPHNNAERLEVATIYGFQVIIQKDKYKVGDQILYIPIDSILPIEIEKVLFPEGSKITLYHHRVRQIKIRGLASQGMVVDTKDLSNIVNFDQIPLETDLALVLNITKYEPPVPGFAQTIGKNKERTKKTDNPNFHKYNGLDNIKWFPDLFTEQDKVVIQEKLHGTNARAGILPFQATTWFKKIQKFLGLAPKFEKCYGSNNVEISSTTGYHGYYGEDVYGSTFKQIDVFSKLQPNEVVYGEIIGPSIQANYTYGLKELHFVVFDIKKLDITTGKQFWLTPDQVRDFCVNRGFEYVPQVYSGPFNKELTYTLTKGNSLYNPVQKVREGIVIKSKHNYDVEGNKKALKFVSEDYLSDTKNTDNH